MSATSTTLSIVAFSLLIAVTPVTLLAATRGGESPMRGSFDGRIRRLVESRALYLGSAFVVLVLGRTAFLAAASASPVQEGVWRSDFQCRYVTCLVTPDSPRYVNVAGELRAWFTLAHPLAALDAAAATIGARNGIFFSFLAAMISRAGLTVPEAFNALAFLSALVLLLLMRSALLRFGASGIVVLFTLSSLPVLYGDLIMKETFDAVLLLFLLLWICKPQLRWAPLVALDIFALYYDREYYLYAAIAFMALRALSRPGLDLAKVGVLALAVAMAALVVADRGVSIRYLRLYNQHANQGHGSLGSPSAWLKGTSRSLLSPVSPTMGAPNYLFAFFDIPIYIAYVLYVWRSAVAWRRLDGVRTRLTTITNPWIVVFLTSVVAYGIVYTGFYRGRDAFSFLMFVALATLIAATRSAPASGCVAVRMDA